MDWKENAWLSRAIYRLLRAFTRAVASIPFCKGQWLGRAVGRMAAVVPMGRTRVSLDALREVFGHGMTEAELRRLNREVVIHFGQMLFEVPHVFNLTRENLGRYVAVENEHLVREAAGKGKGILFLTAHFGNWELMAAALALVFPMRKAVIVRPIDSPPADLLVREIRTRFGTEIIPKKRSMRRVMEILKQGGAVGVLLDQNVDWYDGVFVPFLGRLACTNKGLALLALRTRAPVIPVFSVREQDGRYRVLFDPEVPLSMTGDKIRDVEETTAAFNRVIETHVREHPEQWFWFHKRWKTKNYCEIHRRKDKGSRFNQGKKQGKDKIERKG